MRILLLLIFPVLCSAQHFSSAETDRFRKQAKQVTIIEDRWGIPHIYGKTDADAVFGLMYLQCQQNFSQVERNYLEIFGRLSELEGESRLIQDLQMQLIYDSAEAKRDYLRSPPWLRDLLQAFADGVNFYLYMNPAVKPAVFQRFEPWFPLMYTDGSIAATQFGGITQADTRQLYGFPGGSTGLSPAKERDEEKFRNSGSNGFAIAPARTASGNAMLYINPHVTFYFRTEVHMVSEEGLNAYGAVTWGNFFIYQGFSENCGWMHTSSYADVADAYAEEIIRRNDRVFYRYDGKLRQAESKRLVIRYLKDGKMHGFPVQAWKTHHGPVLGSRDGRWLSLRENNRSLDALMQSWLRMKARNYEEFRNVMELRANNSNNTVFAGQGGHIAYWHGNFMPRRDTAYDWSQPVNGTSSATEWKGIHALEDIIQLHNPANGWIQNCNSTPFTAAGERSPRREDYPRYMAMDGQNARALNAARLLSQDSAITLEGLIAIGYNRNLLAYDILLPPLVEAYDHLEQNDPLKTILGGPVHYLRTWDLASSASSIATTLAVLWSEKCLQRVPPARNETEATDMISRYQWMAERIAPAEQLRLLRDVVTELEQLFGTWQTAWGELNRYQRNPQSTNNNFSDSLPSLPAGLAGATWGSLPSYTSRRFPGTRRRYGYHGNSFVAAVEFGSRVRAKAILTGGESMDPGSIHFTDQAERFLEGKLRDVFFYPEEVLSNQVRRYHPGE